MPTGILRLACCYRMGGSLRVRRSAPEGIERVGGCQKENFIQACLMLEIFLLLMCLLAAKRRSSRRRFYLREVRVTANSGDLSTLAAATVIKTTVLPDPVGRAYRAMSFKGTWAIQALAAADGPIVVGFAHGDYTITEIKEAIESVGSIVQGNKIAQEQSNRLVRIVGTFTGDRDMLNNGNPIKTRLNWPIQIGQTLDMFVYNDGSVMTTGAFQKINGSFWVKDL